MKDNYNNFIYNNIEDLNFIEFPCLTSLGVKNIYTLKDLDFSKNKTNITKDTNYSKLAKIFNIKKENIVNVKQTHSNNVLIIESKKDLKKSRENYDGIITNRNDIALMTNNADCILFIIYDNKKKILANIHSGWKGTIGRIMEKTLDIFQNQFKSDFKDIYVYISPSIRNCHFEVQEDVKSMFEDEFKEVSSNDYIIKKDKIDKDGNKIIRYHIDTIYLNKLMMDKYGILDENIYDSNLCSVCNKDKIHSYRGAKEKDKHKRGAFIAKIC